jgi:hypothetical protein
MWRAVIGALLLAVGTPTAGAGAAELTCGKVVADPETGLITCEVWIDAPGNSGTSPVPGADPAPGTTAPPVTCTYRSADEMGQGNTNLGLYGDLFVRVREDGTIEIAYYKECTDGTHEWVFLDDPLDGAPLPTPAALADSAVDKVEKALPTPEWHTPAETNPRGFAYVNTPTYFWVGDDVWTSVSARAEFGPVWAEATGEPVALIVDPGDNSAPVRCEFKPPEYVPGTPTETFAGCSHRYLNSSALAPDGATFTVTVALEWHITWRGSDGSGGDLGTLTTTAERRYLPVAEVQAIVTGAAG